MASAPGDADQGNLLGVDLLSLVIVTPASFCFQNQGLSGKNGLCQFSVTQWYPVPGPQLLLDPAST